MKIEWLGHAAFLFTSEEGVGVVTDPYEPGCFSGAVKYEPVGVSAYIVTVSHSHADHGFTQAVKGAKVVDTCGPHTIKGFLSKV